MNKTSIYNLKAVINQTGLTPSTLRAWERRYGLVKPQRSPGGHRLYSREDIELLRWMTERRKEGLSISKAAEMWKARQAETRPLPQPVLEDRLDSTTSEPMLDMLRQQWVSACLSFDELAANVALDQAFASTTPETICMEVLQKGLAQVGTGWYGGAYNVQQEHFASAIAMRRLNTLMAAVTLPSRPQSILAACPEGEEHDFILLLVTYLLRRRGWDVLYLGSNVPIDDLGATVITTHPALVLSSAQTLLTAASLGEMSLMLQSQDIPLAYGGGIFTVVPQVTRHISGYYLGTNLTMLPRIIELLVVAPPDRPLAQPVIPEYLQGLASFSQHESAIRTQVVSDLQATGFETAHLGNALGYFGSTISSALKLGDIQLMNYAVDWVDGLLHNHGLPASLSRRFYAAYRQSVELNLGEPGRLILDWLDQAILPRS